MIIAWTGFLLVILLILVCADRVGPIIERYVLPDARRDQLTTTPQWDGDLIWYCGACTARNGWSRRMCCGCGRTRSDAHAS